MRALILYHTKTGHTRRAGEDIAEGLRAEGVEVRLLQAADLESWEVADDAIIAVGSPCYGGASGIKDGLAGPIRSALRRLDPSSLKGKVAGAFSVHCAFGGKRTAGSIEKAVRAAGAVAPCRGVAVRAGVPFSLFTGPKASKKSRERLRDFGQALAREARSHQSGG